MIPTTANVLLTCAISDYMTPVCERERWAGTPATRRGPGNPALPVAPNHQTVVTAQPGAGFHHEASRAMLPSKASSTAVGSGGEAGPPAVVLGWKTCGLTCPYKAAPRGKPDLPTKPA